MSGKCRELHSVFLICHIFYETTTWSASVENNISSTKYKLTIFLNNGLLKRSFFLFKAGRCILLHFTVWGQIWETNKVTVNHF